MPRTAETLTTAARPLTVPEIFHEQARAYPSAPALIARDGVVTYHDLDNRTNRVARRLIRLGVRPGDRIGLHGTRSADMVAAMIAVAKTGAAYVPLQPDLPPQRMAHMVAESRLRLVISQEGLAPPAGIESAGLAQIGVDARHEADTAPQVPISTEDIFYIPFTSGSTGRPKGTLVPHRSIPGFFADTYARWGAGSISVHHSSLSWDGHVLDIYPALLTGGAVAIFEDGADDPIGVARFALRHGATNLLLTSTAFNAVVDFDVTLLRTVSYLVVGGEALSPTHIARAFAELPGTRLINGYGPSECTVVSTVRVIEPEDLHQAAIPIGRAVGDRSVHLLDPHGDPVPPGEIGELNVGGPGVGQGYLARPGLTAERFVPDPFSGRAGERLYRTGDLARENIDGVLEFHGRDDDQIKIRGYRGELSEITQILRTHHDVRDAAIQPRRDDNGRCLELHAYVVVRGTGPDRDGLRRQLAEHLPTPLVPTAIVVVDELPRTANGKLDRGRLPEPTAADRDAEVVYERPETPTELFLVDVWQELLQTTGIGRRHDFLALGGHSLLTTRLISRVNQGLGIDLPLRTVYRTTLLADLAAEIDRLTPAGTTGAKPAAIAPAQRRLARRSPTARRAEGFTDVGHR
jgi:amino acid adenylation domain-containing protein